MMRKTIAAAAVGLFVCASLSFGAEPTTLTGDPQASPPARPAALTASQYAALQAAQSAPEHARVLDVSATYSAREESLEFTRFSDDFWTVVYDVGWPGAYLGIILCAL